MELLSFRTLPDQQTFDSFFSNFFTLPITREKMKIGASF